MSDEKLCNDRFDFAPILFWQFGPALEIIFFLHLEECQLLFHIHPPQVADMEKITLFFLNEQC